MDPVYKRNKKSEIPTLDGKIFELNVEISNDFLDNNLGKELYNQVILFFSKPLYFDANGKTVKNPQNYEKIIIKSVMSSEQDTLLGINYLAKLSKEYQESIKNNSKIVDLSHFTSDFNQISVYVKKESQKYFKGFLKINQESPFLSLKMD
jgi:hypothetical protein